VECTVTVSGFSFSGGHNLRIIWPTNTKYYSATNHHNLYFTEQSRAGTISFDNSTIKTTTLVHWGRQKAAAEPGRMSFLGPRIGGNNTKSALLPPLKGNQVIRG
jgi:hypothetical protein